MAKGRSLTPEEERLWHQAMKDIKPLEGSTPVNLDPPHTAKMSGDTVRPAPLPAKKHRATEVPPVVRHPEPPKTDRSDALPGAHEPLNRQDQQRIRRGRVEVDGKIDLHGMRQSEAHQALIRRVGDARARGHRILLVVTGKGAGKGASREQAKDGSEPFWARGGGVLRQQVPLWLREEPLRSMIFSVQQAHPRHGGGGAFYVFLKRAR